MGRALLELAVERLFAERVPNAGDKTMKSDNPKDGWQLIPLRRRNDFNNTEPIHIVVIDDEPSILDVLSILLKRQHGASVATFDSAIAAWPYLVGEAPDLVITDDRMPGMFGDELARRLLKRNANYPLILCWGWVSEKTIRDEFLAFPNVHWLPRPFTLRQFADALSFYFIPANGP